MYPVALARVVCKRAQQRWSALEHTSEHRLHKLILPHYCGLRDVAV